MAIEKNCFKVSKLDSDLFWRSRGSMSSGEDELPKAVESDDDDDAEFDDCDSGAGSDDFDLLELGETGEEFIQVGDQTCSIPFELYDLTGFGDILSMNVWNGCLSEEERFRLTKYLPDMDKDMFMRTLKELFTGCNIHFGSPINKLFDMFKGGLCEPRVALYRQGMSFFQNRKHYHLLWKHQNLMVANFYQIRDAWINYRGYSIEEKLLVLNIMKNHKALMHEKMEELETDSSGREGSVDGLWSKRLKDRKVGQKAGQYPRHRLSPTLDFSSQGRQMAVEQTHYGKQNPKGTLKVAGLKMSTTKEVPGRFAAIQHGIEMNLGSSVSASAPSRQNKASGNDSRVAVRMRDQIRGGDDAEEAMYEVAVQRERSFPRIGSMEKAAPFKWAKCEGFRGGEYLDIFMGLPGSLKDDFPVYARNRTVNRLSHIEMLTAKPSNSRSPYNYGKNLKYPDYTQQVNVEHQIKFGEIRAPKLSMKGSQTELSDRDDPFWHGEAQVEPFPIVPPSKYGDWNVKSKKWKLGKNSPDIKVSDYRLKTSLEKDRAISMQIGLLDVPAIKGTKMFMEGEETDSDSFEQSEEDEDDNPLMRSKLAFPSGVSGVKSVSFPRNAKFLKKDKKSGVLLDGSSSSKMGNLSEQLHMTEGDNYTMKAKQQGKMHDISQLTNSITTGLEGSVFTGPGRVNLDDDWGEQYKFGRNGQFQGEQGERFSMSSLKPYPAGKGQKAGTIRDYPASQSTYMQDNEDDSLKMRKLAGDTEVIGRVRKKDQNIEAYEDDHRERFDLQLLECNSLTKKRKVKDNLTYMDELDDNDYLYQQQFDDKTPSKKRGKRKLEDATRTCEKGVSEPSVTELGAEDADLDSKAQKKPFVLITPTVHTGISFSVIHLLSAVRMAMITMLLEDSLEIGKNHDKNDGGLILGEDQDEKQEGIMDINNSEQSGQVNVPSLTIQDIVNRVRSNPGDPCILETQEQLQDLVRGVLKIFSSKTAPLGAKGWKTLALYEKITKSWSWVGPLLQFSSDNEIIEEVTSPEAWGLPHKMLVKLVDSFANWLKSGQETLQQIGSLPAPPLSLMQFNLDDKERFRDLRAQKSLNTISMSSDEVRNYFRREEVLRYSIPDRAFSYTAVDGRKSIVAPLRRCGGKPTSKARDHFMLKSDRPPHVTILCLVRDAAARLPGSIGTRADVCTLIRDSQYIVDDVSDAQVNQVVSGALDRLHYERDPCVQFDGERKLWVYLHREREEEDFEDDGTSSTKKWKRQKKEALEPSEQGQ